MPTTIQFMLFDLKIIARKEIILMMSFNRRKLKLNLSESSHIEHLCLDLFFYEITLSSGMDRLYNYNAIRYIMFLLALDRQLIETNSEQ